MDTTKLSVLKFPFVIIDFGSAYIKCGFAGSTKPHAFLKTPHDIKSYLLPISDKISQATEKLQDILANYLRQLYTDWLLIDPRTKKVAIIENILTTSSLFKEALAKAILINLKVPAMLFIPSHVAVIHTMILSPILPVNSVNQQSAYDCGDQKRTSDLPIPFMSARGMLSPNSTMSDLDFSPNKYPLACALVIDCGYSQITLLPIVDGLPLFFTAKEGPAPALPISLGPEFGLDKTYGGGGARPLGQIFKRLLIEELSQQTAISGSSNMLENDDFVDDLVGRVCIVASLERSVLYDDLYGPRENFPTFPQQINGFPPDIVMDQYADYKFIIPGRLREAPCESIFRPNIDGENLASAIVDCITQCPLDCRKALAENLVITGGLSLIPGFKNRLKEEIKLFVDTSDKLRNLPYLQTFKSHALPCSANYASWLGASILTAATTNTSPSSNSALISGMSNVPSPNTLSILARYRSNILRDTKPGSNASDSFDNFAPFLIDLTRLVGLKGRIPDWTCLDIETRPYYRPLGTFSVKGG